MQPDVRGRTTPTTVWLVEDNVDYRDTIRELIDEADDLRCGRAVGSGEELFDDRADRPFPELMLVDIGLPGMSGTKVVERVHRESANTQMVMLTIHEDNDRIFQSICAGASGYLLKTATPQRILSALREVKNGGAPMTPAIARRVLSLFSRFSTRQRDYDLTSKQKLVLEQLIEGKTKKEIAKSLYLSTHTVDTHLRNIYTKLHVHSRTEAVVKALKERIL